MAGVCVCVCGGGGQEFWSGAYAEYSPSMKPKRGALKTIPKGGSKSRTPTKIRASPHKELSKQHKFLQPIQ